MHSSLQYGNGRRSGEEVREPQLARGHSAAEPQVPSHGLSHGVTTCPVQALFLLTGQGFQTLSQSRLRSEEDSLYGLLAAKQKNPSIVSNL